MKGSDLTLRELLSYYPKKGRFSRSNDEVAAEAIHAATGIRPSVNSIFLLRAKYGLFRGSIRRITALVLGKNSDVCVHESPRANGNGVVNLDALRADVRALSTKVDRIYQMLSNLQNL